MNTKLTFSLSLLPLVAVLAGCSGASRDEGDLGQSEGAFSSSFRSVVSCGGVHIDLSNPESEGDNQLVVTDSGAAGYLKGKLGDAMAHDPFSGSLSPSWNVKPGQPSEIVWHISGFSGSWGNPRADFYASFSLTSGNEIRADVRKYTWDQDLGNGTFRKVTDMDVRIIRNGYQEVVFVPGRSGDPDMYQQTGNGWNEWEIANWTFRGCSNQ